MVIYLLKVVCLPDFIVSNNCKNVIRGKWNKILWKHPSFQMDSIFLLCFKKSFWMAKRLTLIDIAMILYEVLIQIICPTFCILLYNPSIMVHHVKILFFLILNFVYLYKVKRFM